MPKIIILASGNGSNLQAIIDAISTNKIKCEISKVIVDRECFAFTRAKNHGIPAVMLERKVFRQKLSNEIGKLIDNDCNLIILAGFLSILDDNFTSKWKNKIINIHPSLLPKYGGHGMWGRKVHEAVLANHEMESGCTIHFVNNQIDGGEIIHQEKVPVYPSDDVESLQSRISQVEHKALTEAIIKLI